MYLLILFLPLLNAFVLGLLSFKIRLQDSLNIAIFNMVSTLLISCYAFYEVCLAGSPCYLKLGSWISSNVIQISWGLYFDTLTCVMLIVVTAISTCVHIYSMEYMKEDPHLQRFISYLSLFTFFMLLLVTADNLLQMFFGWEGVGLCSYLLINFWFQRLQANKAALKAMIINRIGDFGLALGLFTCFYIFKSLDYSVIFALSAEFYEKSFIFFNIEFNALTLACFFLFIGAVGKSAQIGLHTWLPDAMEGPTPVSALIHAATMVTAGIFLVCRCSPLFQYTPKVAFIVTILGCFTAFLAGTTGLAQNDLKRVIAYSTCSQLGYMMFACGVSNYFASMFHLSNHAFFKAALFLSAGSVIHGLADEQDMRKMGATLNLLYYTFITMTIGSLSLKGFPFLAGFYSKDAILELTGVYFSIESTFADWLGDFAASSTAYYSNRSLSRTFLGESNILKETVLHSHDSFFKMSLPLFILSIGGFTIGYLTRDMFLGAGVNFWGNSLFIRAEESLFFEAEFLDDLIKDIPLFFSFTGSVLAFIIYNTKSQFFTRKIFNLKTTWFGIKLYTFLNRKWFFDKVYNEFVAQHVLNFAYKHTYQNLDRGIVELLGPNGIATSIYIKSLKINQINMTFLFHYIFFLLGSIFLSITFILMWSSWIQFIDLRIILLIFIYYWIIFSNSK